MQDFALKEWTISFFFIVRMDIVGIARGAPLARKAQYLACVIFKQVFMDSIPDFSLWKLHCHIS